MVEGLRVLSRLVSGSESGAAVWLWLVGWVGIGCAWEGGGGRVIYLGGVGGCSLLEVYISVPIGFYFPLAFYLALVNFWNGDDGEGDLVLRS